MWTHSEPYALRTSMPLTSIPGKYLQKTGGIVLYCLLVLAAAEFVVRGPVRYLHPTNWNDLAQYYATSRIWLRGQNFANPENFAAMWRDEIGEPLSANTARMHIAPPPSALVLFAPISALPWPAAKLVWLAVLLAGFAVTVSSLLHIAGLSVIERRGLAFLAACLALAPFHTGIATGNQTIVVVGLCAFGVWAACANCDIIAGMSLGAACSLKPHIAGFLLLYYILQRRWRLFATAVVLTVVLVVLAAAWMQFAGVNWVPDYLNNMKFGAAKNTIDDFTTANPIRFMLINLQVPLYSFTHNAKSANLIAFCAGAALMVTWIILVPKGRTQQVELLSLATIAVIGLLPLYHRLYDASMLAIPLCWCVIRPKALARVANAALLLMIPFLLPGAAVLQQAFRDGWIPRTWAESWWWDRLLMPHQTWLLLLMSVLLLYAMRQESQLQWREQLSQESASGPLIMLSDRAEEQR